MIITKCQTVSWLEVIEGLEGVRGNVMIQILQMAFQFLAIQFCVCFDMIARHNSDKQGKESIQFYRSYKSYFICQNITKIYKLGIDYLNKIQHLIDINNHRWAKKNLIYL